MISSTNLSALTPPPNNLTSSAGLCKKSTAPENTFTYFLKLPLELRQNIWDVSLPLQRVVKVFYHQERDTYTSAARIPTALHVCKESRQQALKVYQLSFKSTTGEARVYFNFECDVLHIDMDGVGSPRIPRFKKIPQYLVEFTANSEDIAKVQLLSGKLSTFERLMQWPPVLGWPRMVRFTTLKIFIIAGCNVRIRNPIIDPVVRLYCDVLDCVDYAEIFTRSHKRYLRRAKELCRVEVVYGLIEKRDDDENGLDLLTILD